MQLIIEGKFKAKGRPRFTRSGHAFTPKSTREESNRQATQIKEQLEPNFQLIEGPIELTLIYCFTKTKSWTKKRKESTHYHIMKPDADNLAKMTKDVMNMLVYRDDAQVVILHVEKHYCEKDLIKINLTSLGPN